MKKKLFRIAAVVCMSVSVMLAGQATAFADEVKPLHEFNFDSDSNKDNWRIHDTISSLFGSVYGKNRDKLTNGYNGTGKARYFNGVDDCITIDDYQLHSGAKSIRFQMKKEASTLSNRPEAIISTTGPAFWQGYFIGIGSDILNKSYSLSAKKGCLYIGSYADNKKINFEIQTPESVCDGQWHDILFTWDGTMESNSVKLYMDDMTTPIAQTTPLNESDNSHSKRYVVLGKQYSKLDSYLIKNTASLTEANQYLWYNGYLDDVQFYDTAITPGSTTPGDPSTPSQGIDNRVLLVITMVTGEQKEYEMTADEINDFITWYNSKAESSPTYMIDKDYNHASFISRKDYIAYEQISNFEVNEYNK